MFAVSGWSVSANNLKTQTEPSPSQQNHDGSTRSGEKRTPKSKKRKRDHGGQSRVQITDDDLGDLWHKHLESKKSSEATNLGSEKAEKKIKQSKKQRGDDLEKKQAANTSDNKSNGAGQPRPNGRLGKHDEKFRLNSAVSEGQESPREQNANPLQNSTTKEDGLARYQRRKEKAERKKQQKARKQAETDVNSQEPSSKPETEPQPNQSTHSSTHTAPEAKQLTPLQQRMAQKLLSARFRHLNETLYTSPSGFTKEIFDSTPEAYTAYHAGFRAQVSVWPSNPVTEFVNEFKARGSVIKDQGSQKQAWKMQKKKSKKNVDNKEDIKASGAAGATSTTIDPLPRDPHTRVCTIADLGCGDAALASSLAPFSAPRALNLRIQSFDLAKGDTPHSNLITVADITDLHSAGVEDSTVDVAVCCLSLMGTNWVRVVDECQKVVRAGGEVWIAEIKSRFVRKEQQQQQQSRKNAGNPWWAKDGWGIGSNKSSKKGFPRAGAGVDEENDEYVSDLEEKPAASGGKDETDVSAFVDVWKKRGFALKGEPDLGNKMFIKMKFVRERAREIQSRGRPEGKGGELKFLDGDGKDGDDERIREEGRVLKPCVYKTR